MKYMIEEGHPVDLSERIPVEQKTYQFLDSHSIPYWHIDHDPLATISDCQNIDQILGVPICKNLFLCNEQKTKYYLLLLPGEKKFKSKDLSKALSISRLSFACEEAMFQLLNLTPGSVTIMGLINDPEQKVTLVIDEEVIQNEYFACHPCINTSSIKLRTSDLIHHFLPALNRTPLYVHL